MLGAMDLGIADDGERAGDEQAAQIAVTLLADTAEPVLAPRSNAVSARARSRPRSCGLSGRPSDRLRWRQERWPASGRRRGSHRAACSHHWIDAKPRSHGRTLES